MNTPAPVAPPAPPAVEYVGFWARVLASLIDTFVLGIAVGLIGAILGFNLDVRLDASGLPMFGLDYWQGLGSNQILTALLVIGFWQWKLATPGKMVISAVIVDAETLGKLSTGQAIGRYLAYFVSIFGFMLGFIWVAFDKRKQGWHDKLAGTVVIRKPR